MSSVHCTDIERHFFWISLGNFLVLMSCGITKGKYSFEEAKWFFTYKCLHERSKWSPKVLNLSSLDYNLLQANKTPKLNVYRELICRISITQCFGMLWMLLLCVFLHNIMQYFLFPHALFHVELQIYTGGWKQPLPKGICLTNPYCIDCRCVTATGTATATLDGRLHSVTGQAMAAALTVVQLT